MQPLDKSKQTVNNLEQNYRPIAIKALLAAVLMQKAGNPDKDTKSTKRAA